MLFTYPLMGGIQEISASIGRVTGHGLAGNMRKHYPRGILYVLVGLLFVANTLNLGADIGAMGSCVALLFGGHAVWYTAFFAGVSVLLEIFVPYTRYVNILKWLTLVLFSYVLTVLIVHVPWMHALRDTVIPHVSLNASYLTSLTAILGTTISPYLMFWQASEESEEISVHSSEHPLKKRPEQAPTQLKRIRVDTYFGMAVSNLVAFFIILATAVTLHVHGVTTIETAEQAASALKPAAGQLAFLLFTLGIIGTGLLAVPVLAGSAGYAVGESLGWQIGLEKKPQQARAFYSVIALSTSLGFAMNLLHYNPMRALFWCAVINGVVSVPILAIMILMASQPSIMGEFVIGRYLRVVGWITTGVMAVAAAGALLAFRK